MEQAILDRIEQQRERIVEMLQELIRIPSRTGEERAAQEYLADRAKKLGLDVSLRTPDVREVFCRYPDAAQYPTHWQYDLVLGYQRRPTYEDLEASGKLDVLRYEERPNVVGVWKGSGGGRSMLLAGHVDTVTVEPADAWQRDPFSGALADGAVHGRGAADMKGGLVAGLAAIGCLRELGIRLAGDVIWAGVVNEEHCGNGTLALLCDGVTADAAIVCEPTGLDVFTAAPGNVYWRIELTGEPRSPGARWEGGRMAGVSAIEKLPAVIEALLTLERRVNRRGGRRRGSTPQPLSCVIGQVSGGTYATVTADRCVLRGCVYFRGDLGSAADVMDKLRAAVAGAGAADPWLKEHPPQLAFLHHRDGCEVDPACPLVEVLAGAGRTALAKAPAVAAAPYAADVSLLVNQGQMPAVLFGPGSIASAHKANESVPVGQVIACAKTLALAVYRWCGAAGPAA